MKKFILSLVAVLSMSVSAFAANTNSTDRKDIARLEKTLNLDGYQSKVMEQASITLREAMEQSKENTDEQARNKEMKKALTKNLRSVRGSLDYYQYKKYVQIMNTTLNNYGLKVK